MAYNELALLVDKNGRPIPQYYDVVNDEFKPLGTMSVEDAAVKAVMDQLNSKDFSTDTKLEAVRALLALLEGKDFATQTTLAATLTKLGQLETELATIKANQLSGDQKVQLSGKKAAVRYLSADDTSAVDTGKNSSVTIVPTEGHMARIVALRLNASAITGASSGTHKLQIYVGDTTWMSILDVLGDYNKDLSVIRNVVTSGSSVPSDAYHVQRNLFNAVFTANAPLTIKYFNSSDVAQTTVRTIKLVLYEEAIV